MYSQGTICKMIAQCTQQGKSVDEAIAFGEREVEGYMRDLNATPGARRSVTVGRNALKNCCISIVRSTARIDRGSNRTAISSSRYMIFGVELWSVIGRGESGIGRASGTGFVNRAASAGIIGHMGPLVA
jgi:hypothetical protein